MIDLKLKDNEKQNLTKDEIEIAMARKLEILILPHLKRNINFFYAGGNLKGKATAYRQKMHKEEIEELLNKETVDSMGVVCKPLCEMVVEILKDNGLSAETISCDTDMFKHTDVLLTTKSGKKYIINYLEDMENIQTGMKTPDFASKSYYERRYKKFENGLTTDGKSLEGIDFLPSNVLDKIDYNLGYKKQNMYMNVVIEQIKKEFANFRDIMAENEWLTRELQMDKEGKNHQEKEKERKNIYDRYNNMTDDEILEAKMDWIFNYFNDRMDIKGHTDFVMYHSRLLLKEVLSEEEYRKLTRYDCFVYEDKIPENSKISTVLDMDNTESGKKKRFCLIKLKNCNYVFSTKSNAYLKIDNNELSKLQQYANISESARPSDLIINLCDRGNALPLVFHPLGIKIINERADLVDEKLSNEAREKTIQELAKSIKTTDEPITSISIPYPDGTYKYIYIDENDEFVVQTGNKKKIYHYNEDKDDFEEETVEINTDERID